MAVGKGYKWGEFERDFVDARWRRVSDVVSSSDAGVIGEVYECAESGKGFKFIPNELSFYEKMRVPVPKECPDVRYSKRMKLRGGGKLWERKCFGCGKIVQTSFSPERLEKVCCGECYTRLM